MSFVTGFEVVDPTATNLAGPKRKRASKPKVRSGCLTCKGRRLKCDERRPGCRRCAALKVECGGYQNYNSAQSNQERAVVPRTASADLEEILILPLHHFPQDMKYASQQEYQYFNHFAENTGLQLWLNFTPRLWRRLLEQCSSIEPSLRHLIISVGALGKLSVLEAPEDSQLVFARKQYTQALKGFQNFISTSVPGGTSTRIILIASLMIFCFEAQHGEFDAAIRNVRNALSVLREDFASKKIRYKNIDRPVPTPEAEYELVATLVRLDQGFVGYSTDKLSDVDGKRMKNTTLLDYSHMEDTFEIPSFSNLSDARAYLSLVESRTINRVNQFMQDQGDLDFRLPCPLLSVELFNKISSDLRLWARAFAPLYSRERDYDSLHFLNASFICIQALSSDITLRGMHFGEKGLRTKSVEKLADRIVNVAQLIVSHPRFHKKFTCETGIIAALCSVVFVCRDRDIRWSAVECLRTAIPRREGVWDSIQTLRTCEEVLNQEEEGDKPFLVFRSLDAFAVRFGKPPETPAAREESDSEAI